MTEWLMTVMRPRRVLTVGSNFEGLHLASYEMSKNLGLETICVHLADEFTPHFISHTEEFDLLRSQLILSRSDQDRFGVEGQFDLILLNDRDVEHEEVGDWRKSLSPKGVLILQELIEQESPSANESCDFSISVGDCRASIYCNELIVPEVASIAKGYGNSSTTLATEIAHRIVQIALEDCRKKEDDFQRQLRVLQGQNQQNLILLTRKLADQNEALQNSQETIKRLKAIEDSTIWRRTESLRKAINKLRKRQSR